MFKPFFTYLLIFLTVAVQATEISKTAKKQNVVFILADEQAQAWVRVQGFRGSGFLPLTSAV